MLQLLLLLLLLLFVILLWMGQHLLARRRANLVWPASVAAARPLRSGGDDGKNPAGATHMDVRRFSPGQDAPSKNPAGSANP
ncbi:hypothetical protein [[Pseudomonas] boreopolis]|uniref:hypothetical protein n=1 Tax=Xanthomonas boreopolis TaxID=86183 RepID=UPI003DA06581